MWDESAKNLVKKILLSYKTILIGSHSEVEPILDELICDIEYSNAIVHAFQKFRAPFSGKIVHIFPEQSAVI